MTDRRRKVIEMLESEEYDSILETIYEGRGCYIVFPEKEDNVISLKKRTMEEILGRLLFDVSALKASMEYCSECNTIRMKSSQNSSRCHLCKIIIINYIPSKQEWRNIG